MGEPVVVFSTPWRGLCSGLKATREGPVGLTRILLSVFLNSVAGESKATRHQDLRLSVPPARPSSVPRRCSRRFTPPVAPRGLGRSLSHEALQTAGRELFEGTGVPIEGASRERVNKCPRTAWGGRVLRGTLGAGWRRKADGPEAPADAGGAFLCR